MISTRWRKVLVDLWSNKTRTLLVVLSIAVGVFAVGFVSTAFIILLGDMEKDYQSVNPNSASIYTRGTFDKYFASSLESVPGVGQVEGRSSLQAKVMNASGKQDSILLSAVEDFSTMRIDRVRPNTASGSGTLKPLGKYEAYIERSAVNALKIKPGDMISVELEDGRTRELKVADIVYNITSPPYIFTNMVSAFVNPDTMEWLGGSREFNTVYITVATNKTDEAHVKAVAKEVADKIEKSGREVGFTFVMRPGRHWATDITEALGMLMGFLGLMAVFLSAFLVVNTIANLLSQHIRQIGMMKAIGGRTSQIIAMYMVMVFAFGILAILVALPLSSVLGYAIALPIAGLLNFNIGGFRILWQAVLLQTAVALIIPLTAALVPVLNGARISIREAISTYGIGQGTFGKSWMDRMIERIHNLSRPLLISLRNTFRRKARLILTLSTLTMGGAIFIGVFNVRGAINSAIDKTMGYFISDINISLSRPYRIQQLESTVKDVSGVVSMEGWGMSSAEVLSDDKQTAISCFVIAPPSNSKLIQPVLTRGRWMVPEDERALVIGNALVKQRPELKPGDDVVLRINNQETTWHIVGEYQMAGTTFSPILYANYEALSTVTHRPEQFAQLRVVTKEHTLSYQDQVMKDVVAAFTKEGIRIEETTTGASLIQQQRTTIDVIIMFLLVMAVLIAVVGGLGLTGTMSMNVMERTREIGVMRAIGASNGAILQMVIVEGMLIGIISWLLGALLAFPMSRVMNYAVGSALLNSPLDYVFSLDGFLIWLAFVLILAGLASAAPAYNASRLTIREVLAYE